jgi:beta-lactamase regulating signal transducer with metallopeptidase domain
MNTLFDSLFAWLLDFGFLATVLLAAAIVLRCLLPQPASRVMLAWGTWLAIVAGAAVLALPGRPRVDFSVWLAAPAQDGPLVFVQETAPQFVALSGQSLEPLALPQPLTMPIAAAPALSPADIGARAWLAAAHLGCLWLLIGMVRAWRLIARSQIAPEWTREELARIAGRRRLPGVLTNKQVPSALALGTLRPRIILPLSSTTAGNAPAVRAALAHEWAHIAAGDLWLLALERSLLPLLALHPLFWWLRRLTRLDQELAADAAAAGDKPAEYAEALLSWAKVEAPRQSGVAALAMWERPCNLSRRIQMILDPKRQPTSSRRGWSAYAVLALLFALAVGASLVSWRPMSAQDPPQPKPIILLTDSLAEKPLPAPAAEPPAVKLELKLLTLDLRAIADAKVDLPITPDGPADVSKEGLITVQLGGKEASRLVEVVLGIKGAEILSQPQIVTLDGQEASLQVGGELPIAAVEEIVGGERRAGRVETKTFGTKFRVLPRIVSEDRRLVVVEIEGEKTSVNPAWKAGGESTNEPLLSTHKIELAATVELGKTLVLLSPAKRDITADPAGKNPSESLLILLRPSLVEHQYVEVQPPHAAPRTTAPRGKNNRMQLIQSEAADEAKLAEQLRGIRQAVEELAQEREANRQENAALRGELERLKAQLKTLPQLPPNIPAHSQPQPTEMARRVPRQSAVTHVYRFASDAEAKTALERLERDDRAKNLRIAVMLQGERLTLMGPKNVLDALLEELSAKGSLVVNAEQLPGIASTNDPSPVASAFDPHRDGDRDVAFAAKRQTERRLLELDIQAAELELQAALEDFEAAEKLSQQNAISAEELRSRRRLVERAKIQLAKLKVMLEAEEAPADPAGTLPSK